MTSDAGYGTTTEFRDWLANEDLAYPVGVQGEVTVWDTDSPPPATATLGGTARFTVRAGNADSTVNVRAIAGRGLPTEDISIRLAPRAVSDAGREVGRTLPDTARVVTPDVPPPSAEAADGGIDG